MRRSVADTVSPRLLRATVIPLWARHERSPYLRVAAARAREERLSLDERMHRQWRRLIDLVAFAWEHNPFYRERLAATGFRPGDLRSLDDLARLPVLTKGEIRRANEALISSPYRRQTLREKRTSGSTGASLTLFADEGCMQERRGLTLYRDRWTGWNLGEPRAMVWGNPPPHRTLRQKLRRALLDRDFYLDTLGMSESEMAAFAHRVLRRRPTLFFGHAHSLFLFAGFWRENAYPPYRAKGLISTAMVLHDFERRRIEEVFGPVFDRYGCEEVSLMASECEAHEGLHVNTDGVLIEILDDQGPSGVPGKVIVTDLLNRGMPFIRYEVGDRASWSDRPCSCGRTYPMLTRVAGRVADYLTAPDGRLVSGISLTENFATLIPGVDQVQVIQDRPDHLRVRLVPGAGYGELSLREIARMVGDLFGPTMTHTVETTDGIAPEPSGKYRFSINRVAEGAAGRA